MRALEMLLPVMIMLAVGFTARKRNWLTRQQNDGAKKIVFQILFPVLIFHVVFTSDLRASLLSQIIYLDIAWIAVLVIGHMAAGVVSPKYRKLAPYLLITCEGGNVALPLYISLVGTAHVLNIVTFDVAGILINFGLVPVLVAGAAGKSGKHSGNRGRVLVAFLKNLAGSSFVIAVVLGLAANLAGGKQLLEMWGLTGVYTTSVEMLTAPIAGIILFTLGYDMVIRLNMLRSLIGLIAVRFLCCAAVVAGFFLLFGDRMADPVFRLGVLLYFICPTGFPVPMQLSVLCEDEEDVSFMSAFLSVYLIITLIGYTLLSVFGVS